MAHLPDEEVKQAEPYDPWGLLGKHVTHTPCPSCGTRSATIDFYDHTGEVRAQCNHCHESFIALAGAYGLARTPKMVSAD